MKGMHTIETRDVISYVEAPSHSLVLQSLRNIVTSFILHLFLIFFSIFLVPGWSFILPSSPAHLPVSPAKPEHYHKRLVPLQTPAT